jgi:hypothetical protein
MNRQKRSLFLILSLVGLVITTTISFLLPQLSIAQESTTPAIVSRASLPNIAIKDAINRVWAGLVKDDRDLRLGGLFSGIYHVPGEPDNEFWATADRGPNGQVRVGNETRRTFPVPEYSPVIYKIRTADNTINITEEIPIKTRSGKSVTGLSNTSSDEIPYTFDGQTRLDFNPNGLDIEGITRLPDGTFWLCEEYSPSIVHVDRNGTIVQRLVPAGLNLAADTEVKGNIPAIYSFRRSNRGFEAITANKDGSKLFVGLQSPLEFPTRAIGRASRMTRILVLDSQTQRPTAEYVYVFDLATEYGETEPGEMKLGDVDFVNPNTLLMLERTDKIAKAYQIDLSRATNILGTKWSDPQNTQNSLEALTPEQLASNGITPARKTAIADLSQIPGMMDKIEGLTIINDRTIAVGNDNDFGFSGFTTQGRAINNDLPTTILTLRLSRPLPLEK